MIKERYCFFCNKPIGSQIIGEVISLCSFYCNKHVVPVFHWYGDVYAEGPTDVRFGINYKGEAYTVIFYVQMQKTGISISERNEIFYFPYIANITPENFEKKLPTILVFS